MIRLNTAPREPQELRHAMQRFRYDCAPLPQAYIDYHQRLAHAELAALVETYGIGLAENASGDPRLVDDGWCDGMRVLQVSITPDGYRYLTLRWHDGNRAFMRDTGHGWAALTETDLGGPFPEQAPAIGCGDHD